ncbi:DUF58 domain-containing protein [Oceanibium sediminis]|uniref:DUF58 domain-containing protein n=1 Tax=Oceanibium sediminis TaxID=2026339 RepID=UPI000DD37F3F|nr:DUF58 domain-containing protein [Oceanibium sediminis]
MRPGRRLLVYGVGALALSLLIIALPALPDALAPAVWAALLLAAALDAAISPGRRALTLALAPPGQVFSGETASLALQIRADAPRRMPALAEARVELSEDLGGQLSFPLIRTPDGATGEIRIPARKRGVFAIHAVWLSWPSRLGLWEFTPRYAFDAELLVEPNIRPVSSGQIDATVQSELYGVKDTVTRGEGSEFHQLVEFTTGMDSRTIDWKRSARHRDLVAKEMRAERNHQIILCLDNGYLMRSEVAGLARIDHAINAALCVAWAAGLGGDLVGLYSFDAEPRHYLPPQPARAGFAALRAEMAGLAYQKVESNHTLALAHLGALLKRRSLIVIFSDFADTTTAELLVENLAVLNRQHVILFVTLRDPGLQAGQDGDARDATAVAEAVVTADMLRERQLVLDRLARLGVLCLETAPNELSPRLLSAYLDIKARELI